MFLCSVDFTVEFPFQFGRWRSFDSCFPIKADLLDEKCSLFLVDCFLSIKRTAVKQWKSWRRKEFLLFCIRSACMIRFCEPPRMKIRLQDTSLPYFSKTFHSLYLILSWKGIVKSNTKFNNNLRRGLVFLCVCFLSSFFHSNHPKKRGRESWVLKTSITVRRKYITHTIGNK